MSFEILTQLEKLGNIIITDKDTNEYMITTTNFWHAIKITDILKVNYIIHNMEYNRELRNVEIDFQL